MKAVLKIQNLKCGGCENTIRKKLGRLQFIENLRINVADSKLTFDSVSPEDLVIVHRKLSQMGYPVVDDDNSFGKKAKSYVSCALGRIQK